MRPAVRLLLGVVLGVCLIAPAEVNAASSIRVESSSGGGRSKCHVLQISELLATYVRGEGGRAFVDLQLRDTCGGGTGVSTVADSVISAGDLKSNRNRTRLRTTLVDQWGTGTIVTLKLDFTCWYQDPSGAFCLATVTGKVKVNGITIKLDPSTDAAITIVK